MEFVYLLDKNRDPNSDDALKWLVNIDTFHDNFSEVPFFDEELRFLGPCYHILGGESRKYEFEVFSKVFPMIRED